ncbi:hypothetical protein HCN51_42310 [Nonomuraea sp. FMUSA5-5]|uniref:HEAT repeat domain-containing protein n=1 Tax=Nonomuraea composti TaxID=2720023 RepID=A0ABX1BMI9_9ACTN|nr:hypothetical protein [Nonomuraea sp. FMUSA5-5]NJP95998.1 hypothetical protein [Nonomuraea sp. FMUSA5-5]
MTSAPEPLFGLEHIDWTALVDCRGDRGQIPILLRWLWGTSADLLDVTDNRGVRAIRDLEGRFVTSSDMLACYCIRAATPPAVPFLVRLAQDPRTLRRDLSLSLLLDIAVAVDAGPAGCWGQSWEEASALVRSAARGMARTRPDGWFALLEENPDRRVRGQILELLAIIHRSGLLDLLGRLWDSVLRATDAISMTERVICLAYATAEHPEYRDRMRQPWADMLQGWLRANDPAPRETAEAVSAALLHLPEWIDEETVRALRELVQEQLP